MTTPTLVTPFATPTDKAINIRWTASTAGSDTITHYQVQVRLVSDSSLVGSTYVVDPSTLKLFAGGLTNGVGYFLQVRGQTSSANGPWATTPTITPTDKTVPDAPTNVRAKVGDKTIVVRWGAPAVTGHSKITNYLATLRLASDDSVVSQVNTNATTFATTFNKLANDTIYYVRVRAINAVGQSDFTELDDLEPTAGAPAVFVTFDSIGPDKIVNTRAGQSLPDAPQITVVGTNVDQPWGADATTVLEWVLYTSTSHATVVGTDAVSVLVFEDSSTSLTISAPVAPGGATADSHNLIGPWRLRGVYVPDPSSPDTTTTVFSPDFYTTEVSSVVIGSESPSPVHDGDTVTLTGPGIGACYLATVTVGGISMDTPLTRVDDNTVTLILPTYGLQLEAAGDITVTYSLNGNVLVSDPISITYDVAGEGPPASTYVPPTEVEIPTGDMPFPMAVQRWVFTDLLTSETYTVPLNPDAMTTPWLQRNVTAKKTTAIDGNIIMQEGSPTFAAWTFSGKAIDAAHYEKLRHWCYDIPNRISITDHFGRVIVCVPTLFDAQPQRDTRRYWLHTYTITATVVSVTPPTVIPT